MSHAIVSETPSEGSAGNPPDVAELFARLDIGHLRYRDFQVSGEVSLFDTCAIPAILQSNKNAALISRAASQLAPTTRPVPASRTFNTNATPWAVFRLLAIFSVSAILGRMGAQRTSPVPEKKHQRN